MKGILKITVRDEEGNIKSRDCVGDLVLDNFVSFITNWMFGPKQYGAPAGTSTPNSAIWGWYCQGDLMRDVAIAIGTGTTSPSASDTSLVNEVASTTSVSTTVGADYITWSASITVSASYTITEAGLRHLRTTSKCICSDCNPSTSWFLLIRDTFTGRSVSSGDTISITFKFQM